VLPVRNTNQVPFGYVKVSGGVVCEFGPYGSHAPRKGGARLGLEVDL